MAFRSILAAALALALVACTGTPPASPSTPATAEPAPIPPGTPAQPGEYDLALDVTHYDIGLELEGGSDEIRGRTAITVTLEGADRLPLDLTGLAVTSVTVDGQPGEFEYERGKLIVDMGRSQGQVSVAVEYRGTPDDGLIIGRNIHGVRTAFVDNWPNRTRFWIPTVDHPSDKATASFKIVVPSSWQVVANGAQIGQATEADGNRLRWHWRTSVPIPTYTMVIGGAPFVIRSLGRAACGNAPSTPDADGCVDVSYWVFPEDVAFADRVFARTPQMVDYFTGLIGPYPYEKLANVQSATRFGGMENSSAIFYSEAAIATSGLSEAVVSHEIAHQWFGDSVTEHDWSHLWLSEGFATYFGNQFFESADGRDAFRALMEDDRRSYLASPVRFRPIVDVDAAGTLFDLLNDNNYEKGGWVLHMLRGALGDEAFFDGVRRYYGRYAGGIATTDDFRAVMEEASGQDLSVFFDQWIFQPGYPVFESDVSYDQGAREATVTIRQVQQESWPIFRLPIDLEVVAQDGIITRRVYLEDRETTIRVPVQDSPIDVRIDPDGWVLKG